MTPKPFLSVKDMGLSEGYWYVPKSQITDLTRDDFAFIQTEYLSNNLYYNNYNTPYQLTVKDYRRATTEDLRALIRNLYIKEGITLLHKPIDLFGDIFEIAIEKISIAAQLSSHSIVEVNDYNIANIQEYCGYVSDEGYVYHKGNFAEIIDNPTSNIIVDVEVAPSGNPIVKVDNTIENEELIVESLLDGLVEPITEVEFEDEHEVEVTEQYWWYLGNPNTIKLIADNDNHTLNEAKANGYIRLHTTDIQTYCKLVYTEGTCIYNNSTTPFYKLTKADTALTIGHCDGFYNKSSSNFIFSSSTNEQGILVVFDYFFNNGKFRQIYVDNDEYDELDYKVVSSAAMEVANNSFSSIRSDKSIESVKLESATSLVIDHSDMTSIEPCMINKPVDTAIFCKDDSEFIIPEVVIKPPEVSNKPMRFCIDED